MREIDMKIIQDIYSNFKKSQFRAGFAKSPVISFYFHRNSNEF